VPTQLRGGGRQEDWWGLVMNKKITMLVTALALTVPVAMSAQDRWEAQVRAQMVGVGITAATQGYRLNERLLVGSLRNGHVASLDLTFQRGVDYLLVATCDADCDDVDLVLREDDGREIAADRDSTDLPVLRVPGGHPGLHRLNISMASCSASPCRYSVAIFTR
jgi:type II secretory pathway pseudopilin PulG